MNVNIQDNTTELQNILAIVNALPDVENGGIVPTGTIQINVNGLYDVTEYASALVAVPDNLVACINGTIVEYESEDVTQVTNYGFYGLSTLTSVNLPNATSVKTNAFMNCTNLKNVNLPKVTLLGNYAFQGCTSIVTLDFPVLATIQGAVFTNNTSLVVLILRNENKVCSLGNKNVFNGTPIASGTGYVYVPDNLVESYKSAANWSTYAAQIKPISELNQ